jgi:hypothetical protein
MYVIAKRTILFIHEDDARSGQNKTPRKHVVNFSKDPQEIPDWVTEQDAFAVATQDGTLTVVVIQPAVTPKLKLAEVNGEGKAIVQLDKMTKDELQLHALEVHGLELDDKLKKEEMVAAIKEAAAQ